MRQLNLNKASMLIEPGPVVLVTTWDGSKNNIMAISWTMVVKLEVRRRSKRRDAYRDLQR